MNRHVLRVRLIVLPMLMSLMTMTAGRGQGADQSAAPASLPEGRPRPALRARVDPRVELMSIIFRLAGNPEYSHPAAASLSIIVHEFCHPYSNPLFFKHPEPFRKSGQALLARHREALRRQAYGSWQAVICETLVRASVVRYLEANHGPQVARAELQEQEQRSFKWLPGLCEELARYERNRDQYPAFEDFTPELAAYLDEYVSRTR